MRYVLFALALLIALPAHAGKSPPKILLRVHIQTPGEGMSENQATTVYLPPNGEPVQIRALPEASEQNLVAAEQTDKGLLVSFDHPGQVALSVATAENQGRIMVVFLNGYILYAPVIDEQITSGQLLIPRKLPEAALKLLQETAQENLRAKKQ